MPTVPEKVIRINLQTADLWLCIETMLDDMYCSKVPHLPPFIGEGAKLIMHSVFQQMTKWLDSDRKLLSMTEEVDYDTEGKYPANY